jgi:hypothetical protein
VDFALLSVPRASIWCKKSDRAKPPKKGSCTNENTGIFSLGMGILLWMSISGFYNSESFPQFYPPITGDTSIHSSIVSSAESQLAKDLNNLLLDNGFGYIKTEIKDDALLFSQKIGQPRIDLDRLTSTLTAQKVPFRQTVSGILVQKADIERLASTGHTGETQKIPAAFPILPLLIIGFIALLAGCANPTGPEMLPPIPPAISPDSREANLLAVLKNDKTAFRLIMTTGKNFLKDREIFLSLIDNGQLPQLNNNLDYLFLKNIFPECDFDKICKNSTIKRLFEQCQNLKPPIEYFERIKDTEELTKLVQYRKHIDPARPVAVLIYNKNDYNGAFADTQISELIKQGYQVCYYEVEKDTEIRSVFEEIGRQRKIDLTVFAGHGKQESLMLGDAAEEWTKISVSGQYYQQLEAIVARYKNISEVNQNGYTGAWVGGGAEESYNEIYFMFEVLSKLDQTEVESFFRDILEISPDLTAAQDQYKSFLNQSDKETYYIDTSDVADFVDLNKWLAKDGVIILESCSNGAGKDNTKNNANFIANMFPGHNVFSEVQDDNILKYLYDSQTGKVIGIVCEKGESYMARA